VAAGTYVAVEAVVNSVTKPAETIFRTEATVANLDDIDTRLGAPAGASVSADIAAVKVDTAAVKVDLESGPNSLANILTAVNSIKNNAGFAVPVPAQMLIPTAGSNVYRIPVTVYDNENALLDPDSNTITVGLVNQAGTSRNSYLGSTTMTRDSLGQYHVDVTIAAGATVEELIFTFSYAIATVATARKAVTETIADVAASGLALQSTLLATQTTVNANNTILGSGTFGNAAIKTAVDAIQSDMTSNVEGAGFSNTTDSLHAISAYLIANIYTGGRAI
jgi:hypothetical protein